MSFKCLNVATRSNIPHHCNMIGTLDNREREREKKINQLKTYLKGFSYFIFSLLLTPDTNILPASDGDISILIISA